MGKPQENGHVKIRASEYVCPACNFTMEKQAYEDTLTANVEYDCPHCRYKGEIQIPYIRKSVMGTQSLRFQCQKCKENIDITKKMKKLKDKKKGGAEDAVPDEGL